MRIAALALILVLAACGGGAQAVAAAPRHARPAPIDTEDRRAAMDAIGRKLYASLSDGRPEQVLFDDEALRSLLETPAATRASALRPGVSARLAVRPEAFRPMREAQFSGICLQNARVEDAAGPLGLRSQGWVFDRALVIGTQPGGRRIASWVEGTFLFTDAGFGAIDLWRVEEPRWEHADLELAPCDMESSTH